MLSRRRRRRRGCAAAASAALNTLSDCSIFALRLKCNLLLLQPQRQSASLPSSPPSLPFSLTPPHLSTPLPTCLGSAQCNYFKLSLGCRCAASADYLWLPSVRPLTPLTYSLPPSATSYSFSSLFSLLFFSLLVHWFSLIGFLWCKVFLTPVTFLATFCCTCHTHLPIEQCDAKRRVRCAISISILNTSHSLFLFLSLSFSPLSFPLPFAVFNFNAKSINSLQGAS